MYTIALLCFIAIQISTTSAEVEEYPFLELSSYCLPSSSDKADIEKVRRALAESYALGDSDTFSHHAGENAILMIKIESFYGRPDIKKFVDAAHKEGLIVKDMTLLGWEYSCGVAMEQGVIELVSDKRVMKGKYEHVYNLDKTKTRWVANYAAYFVDVEKH